MSFYKYVNTETLERILNGTIKLTQPSGFNDPFELSMEIYDPYELRDKTHTFRFDTISPRRDISRYQLSEEFSHDNCNDVISRKLIRQLNEAIGILCLSKNKDSHLMWAHYADSYKGAIIEFDSEHDFFEGAFEVKYVKQRPKFHIDYLLSDSPIPVSELCSKPNFWEYEKEWRIVRSLKDCNVHKAKKNQLPICTMDLPKDIIKSVTLGERTNIETIKKVINKLKDTNTSISIATIDFWEYKFRYELVKLPHPISKTSLIISPRTADVYLSHNGAIGELAKWMKEKHPHADISNLPL